MSNQDQSIKLKHILVEGIAGLGLELQESQIQQLLDYLGLLIKWNSVYNLTSVRNPEDMVRQHLLDTLAAVPAFSGAVNVLDVGAGGGLPGMVLAVAYPEMKVSLIDTVSKKTAFLTQVKAQLGLNNVTVYTGRVEQLVVAELFDVITSRAFSELANFVTWAGHHLSRDGHMIAMKGQMPNHEIDVLPSGWAVTKVQILHVPGLDAQRHLLWLERVGGASAI